MANVNVPPFTEAPSTVVGGTPQSVFEFDFPFWESADILVYVDGVLLDSADYSVEGFYVQGDPPAAVEGGYGSGEVTLDTPVSSCTVTIDRFVVGDRRSQFSKTSPLPMPALNGDLNRLTARQQDIERLERSNRAYLDAAIAEAGSAIGLIGKVDLDGGNVNDAAAFRANIGTARSVTVEQYLAPGDDPTDPAFDSTAAIQAAIAYVASIGGGFVDLESANGYYANPVITGNNVWLRWLNSGKASLLGGALRPFDGTKATLTIGDGTTLTRNCGLINPNISGVKIGGNYAAAADNCPAALDIKGNVSHLEIHHPDIYGGLVTVRAIPSSTKEIVAVKVFGGSVRNDITDSTDARTVLAEYVNSDGYFNDFVWFGTKVNGPAQGAISEHIGGALFEAHGCYLDMYPGASCLFTDGGAFLFHGCNLDPHGLDEIIIRTDDATTSLNRVGQGDFRHGPQKWQNGSATVFDIPDQANFSAYRGALEECWYNGSLYFGRSTDRYSTTERLSPRTDTGPMDLFGMDFTVQNATQATSLTAAALQTEGGVACKKDARVGGKIEIYGSNASSGGFIDSSSASGGLFIGSNVAGQDIQIAAGGGAYVRIRGGAGLRPHADNTDANGIVGNAWAFTTSHEHRDGAGLKLLGARKTGWAVASGTATRTTFDTTTVTTAQLAERVKALIDDFHATAGHGLIGT